MKGNQRKACRFYRLPWEVDQPAEWVSLEYVQGGVRLEPVKKIKQKPVCRMYHEWDRFKNKAVKDKDALIKKWKRALSVCHLTPLCTLNPRLEPH